MVAIMTNTYEIGKGWETKHMVTGFIGVFENYGKADDAINEAFDELKVPQSKRSEELMPRDGKRALIGLNKNGKFTENYPKYVIEIMAKDAELNQVFHYGD